MRAPLRVGVWLLGLLVLPASARGDAGAVVLRETRGDVVVTLLAGPVPLRAGPVEIEVVVQERATGAPVLAAAAGLRLVGPGSGDRAGADLRTGAGGSPLFQGARVTLGTPGTWQLELGVREPDAAEETFHARLEVAPPRAPARRYWPYIAAAPLGVALLALHQALGLARRRSGRSRARRLTPTPRDRP